MARYLIKSALGPQRHMTPEGFLICSAVPIARTGEYEYSITEGMSPGIEPDEHGLIRSRREADEVFAAEALASFEGKPVTLGHPPVDQVTPDDWKSFAVGHVANVRRGTGDDADKVLADLVISDRSAIEAIEKGLREVSCGYDVELEQTEPGVEIQRRIRGNHVALVDAGRAGHECAIKDSKGGAQMDETKSVFSWEQVKEMLAMLLGKGADKPAEVVEEKTTVDEEPAPAEEQPKVDDEIDELKGRIAELEAERDALKAELEGEVETELIDEDEAAAEEEKADEDEEVIVETEAKTDAAPHGLKARVEILAPGMRCGKADSKSSKVDVMRRALDRACDDDMKRSVIMSIAGRRIGSWASVKDHKVALIFKAASAALATINNSRIPAPVAHGDAASNMDYAAKVAERYASFGK